MTGRYRAGIMVALFGLLSWVESAAQRVDTVRVGQEADTPVVTATDGTASFDSVQPAVDTSVVSSKDAAGDHPDPIVLRAVADSAVADWKSDKAYAYANDPDYWRWRELRQRSSSGRWPSWLASRAFEYFILSLMGAILLYAIVRIIVANRLQLFYRSPKRRIASGSKEEEGSLEDDLDGQLMHFMQIRDYRQAVRFLYLKTLRLLNERGLIRYQQESTNQEYWQQLRASPQGAPFRDLTMIYEKVWYGEFPLGDTLFNRLHQYFEDFYKSVRA